MIIDLIGKSLYIVSYRGDAASAAFPFLYLAHEVRLPGGCELRDALGYTFEYF